MRAPHAPARCARRATRVLAVATAALCFGVLAAGEFASAASPVTPVDEGTATIVDANDPSHELTRGDGDVAFTFRFPAGFACPGDSMHDNWRFQTFMVPAADDVTALDYGVIGPSGANQYALYGADRSARSYANLLTQANTAAGLPGLVGALPPLNFAVVAGEALPPGTYRVGYACTFFGATANYSDVEVVVTATSDDFAWHLAGVPAVDADDDGSANWLAVVIGVVLGALVLGFVLARRRRPLPRSSKEHS